jgi:hypothetical protein
LINDPSIWKNVKDHIRQCLHWDEALQDKKIEVYKKIQIFLPQYERFWNMEMKSEIIEMLHLKDITKSIIKSYLDGKSISEFI